ncbi:MAG: hypothetical protein E6J71_26190 [Deltaproteobacteria bacterium]|nr:MAG: hypothetical protein E6J71_26190 [Deltaproteobacteria bacterium]
MKLQWSCRATVIAVLVASLGFLIWPSRAQAVSSFGGQATGVQVFVPATGLTIKAASGQLPPTGGEVDASLLSGDIPGSTTGGVVALAAGALHSVVVGLDETNAETSLTNVSLTVSGNGISSDFLMAHSNASCGPAIAGSSQLQNLVINGQPITVTGNPNQTVSLPNGTATINEQTPAVAGSTAELRVVALHVITIDAITGQVLADVQLAIADAMIDCQPGSGPPGDATTGGGWIPVAPGGGKGTFGVEGAYQPDGTLAGHVVYIDHDIDLKVQSTGMTNFVPGCTSHIDGTATANSAPVTFNVIVTDHGEPGTSDTFSIVIPELGYSQSGTLGGGNIKVHRLHCQ